MYIIYAKFMYRYTNVKIDIFEKEFFLNKKVWWSAAGMVFINHQVYLKFSKMICLSIKLLFSEGKLHQL